MSETTPRHSVPWDAEDHCWDEVIDPATRELYQSYARPLGVGARPALLTVDLYKLVFAGGPKPPAELRDRYPSSCGQYAHAALEPITTVLAAFRDAGMPVFHVTAGRRDGLSATNRRPGGEDDDARAFHPACAPVEGESIVPKERASAFYGTSLVAQLVEAGVDTLVVVGETTSGCVRASTVDAFSNGFRAVVVEEAVFDRAWLPHCVSLFDLHHKYADVLRLPTALRLLKEAAGDGR